MMTLQAACTIFFQINNPSIKVAKVMFLNMEYFNFYDFFC